MVYKKIDAVLDLLKKKPYLLLVISTICWGGNFVAARALVQTMPPIHLSMMRLGLGFIIFLPFACREWQQSKTMIIKNWKKMMLFAMTGIAGFNSLLYVALQTTTAINASLVNTTSPLLIVALAAIFLKEKLNKIQYLGIAISFLGVTWLVSHGNLGSLLKMEFNSGDLLVILAVIMWAIYSILMRMWGGLLPKKATFLTTLLLGFSFLLPFFYWEAKIHPFDFTQLSLSMWLAVLYIAIFPTIVAFVCWNEGVIAVGASKASNFLYLSVFFSGIFATFIGETYTLVHLFGAVLIISGVLFVSNPELVKKYPVSREN